MEKEWSLVAQEKKKLEEQRALDLEQLEVERQRIKIELQKEVAAQQVKSILNLAGK